jgi:hypothetical protein
MKIYENKIILEDRYSNKTMSCTKNTIFILGKDIVGTIRKNNFFVVDFKDTKGNFVDWFCLEYVLKNQKLFFPIVLC